MGTIRRGKQRKTVEVMRLDEGTKETRAKLDPPIWLTWPNDLRLAASAIDQAVRLVAQSSMAHAQDYSDYSHVNRLVEEEWPKGGRQERLYQRYMAWARVMVRWRWPVRLIVSVVVLGEETSPEGYNMVYDALSLFVETKTP